VCHPTFHRPSTFGGAHLTRQSTGDWPTVLGPRPPAPWAWSTSRGACTRRRCWESGADRPLSATTGWTANRHSSGWGRCPHRSAPLGPHTGQPTKSSVTVRDMAAVGAPQTRCVLHHLHHLSAGMRCLRYRPGSLRKSLVRPTGIASSYVTEVMSPSSWISRIVAPGSDKRIGE
jgi:hypothetical protein